MTSRKKSAAISRSTNSRRVDGAHERQLCFHLGKKGINIDELKAKLYTMAREIHLARFPYNDLLYQKYDEEE